MEQGILFDVQPLVQKARLNVHANGKDWLIKSLLNGCYIMERGGHSKRYQHCLFELNGIPVKKISKEQWKKINVLLTEKKYKKRYSKYYLSLKEVRALHGNTNCKKLYKKYKQEQKLNSQQKD